MDAERLLEEVLVRDRACLHACVVVFRCTYFGSAHLSSRAHAMPARDDRCKMAAYVCRALFLVCPFANLPALWCL